MREAFLNELKASGFVHRPLPLHREKSLEAAMAEKKVLKEKTVYPGEAKLTVTGVGTMEEGRDEEGTAAVFLRGPMRREGLVPRPEDEENGLVKFQTVLNLELDGLDLSDFNRLVFDVFPRIPGGRNAHLRCGYINEGRSPVPDVYGREGQCLFNLDNHCRNSVIWECASLPKDRVTRLWFKIDTDGPDTSTAESWEYVFSRIRFEKVENPEQEEGWMVQSGQIAMSMAGYQPNNPKIALMRMEDTPLSNVFTLLDEKDQAVFSGMVSFRTDLYHASRQERGLISDQGSSLYAVLDFSAFRTPGFYRLSCGTVRSPLFEIGEDVLKEPLWKLLNFIFCERCGYPVPGKHGRCHGDVYARFRGKIIPYAGGWHDAGDLSQQSLQTAELTGVLFELAMRLSLEDPLYPRLMEEGLWGLEQVLKTRLGDGYRASSVGLSSWTNGLIGDEDDMEVRVHNQAFQNFFQSSIEALAADALKEYDPELAEGCLTAAREDYAFARERFEEKGIEYPIMWEHTLGSSLSLYYAAALEASSRLGLSEDAALWAKKLLACQETGHPVTGGLPASPMTGYFYRDESHRCIVHFNHQGRDHLFVQALMACCEAFPDHPDRPLWEQGMRLYGQYLKKLSLYASAYGMLPAGIHHISEAEDRETFPLLHLLTDFEKEKENYRAQLEAGIDLGNGYYLRQFPVWFSFRGNSAIHLGMGRAAALLGSYFEDEILTGLGMDQLSWVFGRNPFAQSLVYGVGSRYASQDANFLGETAGEIPVGIETRAVEDVPYWPAGTNSTYKEVWLTSAERVMGIIAAL